MKPAPGPGFHTRRLWGTWSQGKNAVYPPYLRDAAQLLEGLDVQPLPGLHRLVEDDAHDHVP